MDNNAVVKKQVSGNSPFIKTIAAVSAFFRFRQSWSLSGPGNLPTPRVGKLPLDLSDYLPEAPKNSVSQRSERAVVQSRKTPSYNDCLNVPI